MGVMHVMAFPICAQTCCFSGYRPEKMPAEGCWGASIPDTLYEPLQRAVRGAVDAGCTDFITGMSRGFDLWAAQTVLLLRREAPIKLICALPFSEQEAHWAQEWRALHALVRARADAVCVVSPVYHAGCFQTRNRFMVDSSSRLICYFDGRHGGTAYTVHRAATRGLHIENLADGQLTLELP